MKPILTALLALLLGAAPSVSAQRLTADIGIGPTSQGPALRTAVGLNGRTFSPSIRFVGSGSEIAARYSPGVQFSQSNLEVGLTLTASTPVSTRFSVSAGTGLAVALAARSDLAGPRSEFDLGGLAAGLTAPIEGAVTVRLSPRLGLHAVAFHSLLLTSSSAASPDQTPERREYLEPGLTQSGFSFGIRFGSQRGR